MPRYSGIQGIIRRPVPALRISPVGLPAPALQRKAAVWHCKPV
nr:MAG TPA: hypothetical protein [Caudoviricetes sp.]